MPVAIAEARNLVEAGSRVAFFADSTGEVERVADIFNEYGVPYQLAWTSPIPRPSIWPDAPTWPAKSRPFT